MNIADNLSHGSLDVLHGSVDSGRSSSTGRRRAEVDRMEETEQSPKSSRAASQLTADAGEKLVKRVSGTDNVAAASSLVEKSSVEPVAGPSGLAPMSTRSQNISKEKSSGKN